MINIAGLWKRQTKDGKTILVGNLSNNATIMILPNERKSQDKHPDFNVVIKQNDYQQNNNQNNNGNQNGQYNNNNNQRSQQNYNQNPPQQNQYNNSNDGWPWD